MRFLVIKEEHYTRAINIEKIVAIRVNYDVEIVYEIGKDEYSAVIQTDDKERAEKLCMEILEKLTSEDKIIEIDLRQKVVNGQVPEPLKVGA
ncbi:hypothetical protein [Methanocaldococcus sp.]|uniref:hypothetical protein n=1 Tax=Methanocaldococcus sp. TaxID=2152917 RepID=UPI002604EAE0|nr:hypothetical protein [Methanocaldococcus sp.]MCQ6254736.1 hypothetical protein [Methanocaldococcus sp.]